jgi:hypothetical protein
MSFTFQVEQNVNESTWGPELLKKPKIFREDYPEISFSPFSNEEYVGRGKIKIKIKKSY